MTGGVDNAPKRHRKTIPVKKKTKSGCIHVQWITSLSGQWVFSFLDDVYTLQRLSETQYFVYPTSGLILELPLYPGPEGPGNQYAIS